MVERVRVSDKDKKAVRAVMKEVFGTGSVAEDEDTIMKNFQRYAQNTINESIDWKYNIRHMPIPARKCWKLGRS